MFWNPGSEYDGLSLYVLVEGKIENTNGQHLLFTLFWSFVRTKWVYMTNYGKKSGQKIQ